MASFMLRIASGYGLVAKMPDSDRYLRMNPIAQLTHLEDAICCIFANLTAFIRTKN